MNAVAAQNKRCKDPAFHFILSWPHHENPEPDKIFDAAEHALKALGLADHQYVLAVHANTAHRHCHIAVSRINPVTFKSHNIEWPIKTLHLAARQSEIKHGWFHDNGIYIVEQDGHGQKKIILNKNVKGMSAVVPYAHANEEQEEILPSWHDPDSLESWLKSKVSKELKRALPKLKDWEALHNWLYKHEIFLSDTGGGGMRLHATSLDTGEIVDVPASRGLRLLKRGELEQRWGPFTASKRESENFPDIPSLVEDDIDPDIVTEATPCTVPDLSQLTLQQRQKGTNHVIRANATSIPGNLGFDEHFIYPEFDPPRQVAERSGRLHELSGISLDGDRRVSEMLLSGSSYLDLGDSQTGKDKDLRYSGTTEASRRSVRSLLRDNSKREERKIQRAIARADLRSRFAQYGRVLRNSDSDHYWVAAELRADRNRTQSLIREEAKAKKRELTKNSSFSKNAQLQRIIEIDTDSTRRLLHAETIFQEKTKVLRIAYPPPLGWREWLHEQSSLGDQAALSALRGIIYQARRDAKYKELTGRDIVDEENDTDEYSDQQHRKLMARLLDEERKETAIRSSQAYAMRPYEVDALLVRYSGIQWHVTGNGNVEYSDSGGSHLFTDRGNRVTFDRARVTDEEIRLALIHAEQKFGKKVTLTGDDAIFSERMAQLADDMGITVLNPELQSVIVAHRNAQLQRIAPIDVPVPSIDTSPIFVEHQEIIRQTQEAQSAEINETPIILPPLDRLKAKVLSIDPRAQFEIPDITDNRRLYSGVVVASLETSDNKEPGYAQHAGRGIYTLHLAPTPDQHNNASIDVRYRESQPVVFIPNQIAIKSRDDK